MKSLITEQATALAKTYWQQGALVLLALLIVLQTTTWGMTWWDLRKIDRLIGEAKSPDAKTEATPTPGAAGQPGEVKTGTVLPEGKGMALGPGGGPGMPPAGGPGGMPPGQPGQPGQSGDPKQPAKNIFRRDQIPYQLSGIYMNTAVIDGQYVKVGERVGKAVVKEIAATTVKIQEDGKDQPRTLELFQGSGGGGGGGGGDMGGGMSRPGGPRPGGPGSRPQVSLPGQGRPPQTARAKGPMSDFQNMTREQRQETFKNMTPEQREQMRQQFGGVRRGGPGGRGQ